MLRDAFRMAFRHFTTFFLIVAIVSLPLHLTYGLAFRRVIAAAEFHDAIEDFPAGREVAGVTKEDLTNARTYFAGLEIAELGLLLLLTGAFLRVLEIDARGGLPRVTDAYRHLAHPLGPQRLTAPRRGLGIVAAGAAFALVTGIIVERLGLTLVQPVPDQDAWAATALVRTVARAFAAPFALTSLALVLARAKATKGIEPTLY